MTSMNGAGIVLIYKDRVLLLKGIKTGIWSFPKGHAEQNDKDLMETAVRETKEETGYIQGLDYTLGERLRLDKRVYWKGYVSSSKRPLISNEHSHWRWVTVDEINWLNVNSGVREWQMMEMQSMS